MTSMNSGTRSHPRAGRSCSRTGCRSIATKTLIYVYADSTAILGPLATFAEPHSYDLCETHSSRLTLPNGWSVSRIEPGVGEVGPNDDDLMAIADAVREVAASTASNAPYDSSPHSTGDSAHDQSGAGQSEIGRRGHLRSIPTDLS
jgi:hypothetical protein